MPIIAMINNKKKMKEKRKKRDQWIKAHVRTVESAGAVIWRCSVNKGF